MSSLNLTSDDVTFKSGTEYMSSATFVESMASINNDSKKFESELIDDNSNSFSQSRDILLKKVM